MLSLSRSFPRLPQALASSASSCTAPRSVASSPTIHLHLLEPEGYRQIERSTLLPALDFDLLARCVHLDDQHAAVIAYRDALRSLTERV